MLSQKDRNELREIIEKKIIRTSEDVDELRELTKPVSPENSIGRISRMDAINNKSVNEAALNTARQKLVKLEFALSKVDQEDFGICIVCNQTIPEGRLMFMPESARCVSCADR